MRHLAKTLAVGLVGLGLACAVSSPVLAQDSMQKPGAMPDTNTMQSQTMKPGEPMKGETMKGHAMKKPLKKMARPKMKKPHKAMKAM